MKKANVIKEIRAFNRFYTNVIGVVDRHILNSPYSLTEVRIMYEVYHGTDVTARKIKRLLRVDEGYLSRTIEKLVKDGLIARKQSTKDGRVFVLLMTEKGKKEFLLLNSLSESAVESKIVHLSSSNIVKLVSAMNTIRKLLTKEQPNDSKHQGYSDQA